uniref:Lectin-like domain-containing protein n=1 Tax=Eubacterium cellulosolvens (strain ATCC 43171 / JCM 9499 / 6) TaxID=633697 RepID=I5AUY4_EUBC6
MRKKLLTLLLVASTISSTLVPAQSVFADTTGDADVSIVETFSDDQPTSSDSKKLFKEVDATDYEALGKIPYGEIEYGDTKRKDIKSEVDLNDIEAKTVKDAYPISHEDIYIPETELRQKEGYEEYKNRKEHSKGFFTTSFSSQFKYKYNGFHFDFEISEAAKEYIKSQQPTYPQESGDCAYNSFTEVANKALIAEDLIHKEDVHKIRMSRAQIEYNSLFINKDPLNGFHGDYLEDYDTRKVKLEIRRHLSSKPLPDDYDLRRAGHIKCIMHSLYSGMGPVKETDVNDTRALDLCNNEADVFVDRWELNKEPTPTPIPVIVRTKNDNLRTEDVYYTKNASNKHYAHLTQTRFFSKAPKKTARNKIKAWIYSYGGVGLGMKYAPDAKGDYVVQRHYDFENNCLLKFFDDNPDAKGSHALTIVGWDDTFPADAFEPDNNGNVKNNGAWLVKNSWNPFSEQQDLYGTEMTSNEDFATSTPFSYYRYFWVSYDSPDILEYYGIAFENNNYYDNIYQYDGYQVNSDYAKSSKAANIFTVKDPDNEPTDDKAQELKCVGFETSKPTSYKVEIYRNIPEGGGPTSGTLARTKTGECPESGIYTVELKEPVRLALGEHYSVVVTLLNSNAEIAVEQNRSYKDNTLNDPREDHRGESYIYPSDNWIDVVDVEPQLTDKWPENVRIKAMTVNTDYDSSTIRASLTPTSPTPAPIADCAELTVKAKINGSLTGFEYTVETTESSALSDQIKYIRKTITDSKGNEKKSLNSLPDPKTKNGIRSRSVFLPIDPDSYENTVKIEILDNKKQAVKLHLFSTEANTYSTSYSTSMKEYLDKLKETAIANSDSVTEDFANSMLIHMTCAQNMYKTKATDENDVDLSALDSINTTDFASYVVKRGTTGNTDGTLPRIGLSFNWKKANALSVIYYDAEDPSTIKSIRIDGEDITNSNPKEYQFETIDDHHELTVNLSDIPISDFSKTHTITVENTSGRQIIVKANVYSYIYYMLKSKDTDQTTKNYAKSLALLAQSYNQLNTNDTRYKDFFIF